MSSSGAKSREQFSFAAPGGNVSQSSPGSLTGASSADATIMTMPTGSQVSGEGRVAPPEATSTGSDTRTGNAKRVLKRFTRSTSPRMSMDRSPKRSIERVEIEDAKDVEMREMQLIEELRSARVSYQYLHDEYSYCIYMLDTRISFLNRWRNFRR